MIVIKSCCILPTRLTETSFICDFRPLNQRFAYSFLQLLPYERYPCCPVTHFLLLGHVRNLHTLECAHGMQTKTAYNQTKLYAAQNFLNHQYLQQIFSSIYLNQLIPEELPPNPQSNALLYNYTYGDTTLHLLLCISIEL